MDNGLRLPSMQESKPTGYFKDDSKPEEPMQWLTPFVAKELIFYTSILQVLLYGTADFRTETNQQNQVGMVKFAKNLNLGEFIYKVNN